MLRKIKRLFKQSPLDEFDQGLSRNHLIQSSRIAFIDDEEPLLINELKSSGFSVDHDKTGNDLNNIDKQIYDLVILDYHGVGQRLGSGQGLSLLKYIKRVSPRTRIMAYTSRSLCSTESEFFTLSHVVLPKDLDLVDSLAQIEAELRKAFSKEHLFEALIAKLQILEPEEKEKVKSVMIKALKKNDSSILKNHIIRLAGAAAEKTVEYIICRMFGKQ